MPKPSAPPAPDYAAAATAQGQANVTAANQTAALNNPNVTTPYGAQTVSYTPTGPDGGNQANINQTLTPIAQSTLNNTLGAQNDISGLLSGAAGNVANTMGTPFNENGVPKNPINPGQTGQQALLARLQPQINQNEGATRQRLANQGIPVGSEAWNNEMRQQGQNENDLYSQAGLYGIGLDTQAHQAGLQEALGLYNQPLNELTALMSGSQVQTPQFQQYTGGGQIGAAPVAQAAANQGNYQTAAYNSQMQGLAGLYGGLGSVVGGGLVPGGFLR